MKAATSSSKAHPQRPWGVILLVAVLLALFWQSFLPGYVQFSNDGPLGQQMTAWSRLPAIFTGAWADLNDLGANLGGASVCLNTLIRWALGPVGFSKFLVPISLLILGLGAWTFFRQLRLAPLAVTLGTLAVVLNSKFFSDACWGVATQEIGVGMIFFALALVLSIDPAAPPLNRWARVALAGFAVGMNVMESADIGAIFSLFLAIFVVYHSLVTTEDGLPAKAVRGAGRVVVIAACAAVISFYALSSLIGTQVKGIAGASPDERARLEHWDWATQWSMPKRETLGLFIAGVFGYRMDSPDGGNYWGGVGREPAWDRWYDAGQKGPAPPGIMRFSGGGNYAGVLVMLLALWATLQALRSRTSAFAPLERRFIWFWSAAAFISLLLAYGRFAPFYRLVYALPYFYNIRNPAKFLSIFSFAVAVLFAYGLHGLSRRYLEPALVRMPGAGARFKAWWANAAPFDRRWVIGCLAAIGLSLVSWLTYAHSRKALEDYLDKVDFHGALASAISTFSIRQVGWFVPLLAASVLVVSLILSGALAGRRAQGAGVLLGLILLFDLGRANLPWIVYWDYPKKYETAGPNPVVQFLRDKPYEHRVAMLPDRYLLAFRLPDEVAQAERRLSGLHSIEWNQQLFPYYNIQTTDIIQRPRTPEDIAAYERALAVRSAETLRNEGRKWELTNTRYLLGYVGFIDILNTYFDPGRQRFRIAATFDIVPKPGVTEPTRWEDMTAVASTNGPYAVFDFTGALPRAQLFARWEMPANDPVAVNQVKTATLDAADLATLRQLGTNDFLTLKILAAPEFDPAQTVLLASPVPAPANSNTNAAAGHHAGTVEFTSYAPKDIRLRADPDVPAVLLLNDKYDPGWQVWVDGKQAELLRCNFIMRGVYLTPGSHQVEFMFKPPWWPLYVNLAGVVLALLTLGYLGVAGRRTEVLPAADEKKERPSAARG